MTKTACAPPPPCSIINSSPPATRTPTIQGETPPDGKDIRRQENQWRRPKSPPPTRPQPAPPPKCHSVTFLQLRKCHKCHKCVTSVTSSDTKKCHTISVSGQLGKCHKCHNSQIRKKYFSYKPCDIVAFPTPRPRQHLHRILPFCARHAHRRASRRQV